jgi:Lon protease-like protein
VFPLHAVLFPGGRLPLRIFEQRYMEMAKACLRDGTPFGVCLIREGHEVGMPAVPSDIGCTARIGDWDMPQLGVLQVLARGEQRFRIRSHRAQADGLVLASAELLGEQDGVVPQAYANCARFLQRVLEEQPQLFERPFALDSGAWVSARLAEILPLPLAIKQQLLEMDSPAERLARLSGMLPGALSAPS